MANGSLSNCGHDERGAYHGGSPGDQTGSEYHLVNWYGTYTYRARHPNAAVCNAISSLAVQAAQNDNIGYDQDTRGTFWQQLQNSGYLPSKITVKCNADCSSSTAAIVKAAGYLLGDTKLQNCSADMYTGSEYGCLQGAGFSITSGSFSSSDSAQYGDIFWNDHHSTIWTNGDPNSAGLSSSAVGGSVAAGEFYSMTNTRNDALIREVSYLDSKLKPSIKQTDLRFSVLNYTVFVGGIWKAFCNKYGYSLPTAMSPGGSDYTDIGSVVPTDANAVAKAIIEFFMKKGLSYAAGVGICANAYHESSWNPAAVGDHGTSFGLFQWHNNRGTNMKNYVGSDWASDVSGQLNFCWNETSSGYSSLIQYFQSVPNTLAGAQDVARQWCIQWEQPADKYGQAEVRAKTAESVWKTYIQLKK